MTAQYDLFPAETADENAPTVYYHGDPNRVRRTIRNLIDEASRASSCPWPEDDARYHRKVVPQMACWLPPDEAESLLAEWMKAIAPFGL